MWCHLAALNRIASLDTASGEAKRIATTHLLVLEHYVASYIGALSSREIGALLFLFSRYDHPLPPRLHTLISRQLDRTAPSMAAANSSSDKAASAGADGSRILTLCSRRDATMPGLARIPQASFDAIEGVRGGVLQPESTHASGGGSGSSSASAAAAAGASAASRLVARGFFRNRSAADPAAAPEASQPLTAATVFGSAAGGSSPRAGKGHTSASSLLTSRLDSLLRHHDVAREVADAGISAAAAQQLAASAAAGLQRRAVTGSNIAWALVRQHLFHERALTGLAGEMLTFLLPSSSAAAPAAVAVAACSLPAPSSAQPSLAGSQADEAGAAHPSLHMASRTPRLVAGAQMMAASLLPQEVLLQLLWALARCGVRGECIAALAEALAPPLLHRLPPSLQSRTLALPVDAAASDAAMQGAELALQLLALQPPAPVHLNYVQQVSALWCYAALGTSSASSAASIAARSGSETATPASAIDARLAGAVSALAATVFDGESLAKVQRTLPVPVRRQLQQAHALLTGGAASGGASRRRGVGSDSTVVPGVPAQLPAWLTDGSAAGAAADNSATPTRAAAAAADDAAASPARARIVRAVQDAFRSLLGLKPVAGLLVEGFRLPLAFPAARLAVDIIMDDDAGTSASASPSSSPTAAAAAAANLNSKDDGPVRGDATRDAVLAARGWQLVSLSYAQWRRLGTAQQRAQLLQALTHNLPERERAITEARARARSTGSNPA